MKDLNIAVTLASKRKEKGITQEELASYIGVSKASVSKWETGQSYPDITFLPLLATYFSITVDELLGYEPQMTKEDIRKLYHRLSRAFADRPFGGVLNECTRVIKKYYSCYPLLLQLAGLLVNHHMLAASEPEQNNILREAAGLCVRVKTQSGDVWLSKEATSLEAACYLLLKQPQSILELLGETIRPYSADDNCLAQAYLMMGNPAKAKEITQIGMYQHLILLAGAMPSYLLMHADRLDLVQDILNRALTLADTFELAALHPNTMALTYLAAAQALCMNQMQEEALGMLTKYLDLCVNRFFPYSLHGDRFFDSINEWFDCFDLGAQAPRDEKVIKASMLAGVRDQPAFASLRDYPQYKNIVKALEANLAAAYADCAAPCV